mgnify:CR=1 FL=1
MPYLLDGFLGGFLGGNRFFWVVFFSRKPCVWNHNTGKAAFGRKATTSFSISSSRVSSRLNSIRLDSVIVVYLA